MKLACCISIRWLFFMLLIPAMGHGQQSCPLMLSGTVQDENQEGLPEATISIFYAQKNNSQAKKNAVCDLEGSFVISDICPGIYNIEVRFLGYKTVRQQLTIERSLIKNFSLIPDGYILNELVVERHVEPVAGSQNYVEISGSQLEESQQKSLGKLLSDNIAGVNSIQTGPSIFKPIIHGVHSQRILIVNNNLLLASQQWGAEHAPEIDPFSANSVTVVKNAGGIKYGSGALGGVIVIEPKPLPEEGGIHGKFNLTGEANGLSGLAAAMIDGGVKNVKGLGWRIQGKIKKSGDFTTPNYILSNTGFKEYDYNAAIGFHRKHFGIEAFFSSFNKEIGILRASVTGSLEDLESALESKTPLIVDNFTYAINNPKQQVAHNTLEVIGHYRTKKMQYRLQYGLQINKRSEFDIRRGGLNEVPAIDLTLTTHSVDLEVEQRKKTSHSRCFGFNGGTQVNLNVPGTQRIPFIPNYTNYSIGLYDIEYFKREKALWQAGIRYEYKWYNVAGRNFNNELFTNTLNFHSISGILGVSYFANEQMRLTSNLGTAWRSPNMAELYSLGTHQSAAAIEYGLLIDEETTKVIDPDKSTTKNEQAIKWTWEYKYERKKWYGEISGYVNYIFNYIYLKPRGVTRTLRGIFPYFRYTQTNASFIGADLIGEYAVMSRLKLNASVSWLHATNEKFHDKLIYIPSNRFELSARYETPALPKKISWFASIKTKYVMKQYRVPQTITIREINKTAGQGVDIGKDLTHNFDFLDSPDGYFLLETSISTTIPIRQTKLKITASVDNLLNTTYREYTNRMRYYADEVGRNLTLTLFYEF